MYLSIPQLARRYGVSARSVGRALYRLGIRNPDRGGIPYEQFIVHGIARPVRVRARIIGFRYDLRILREEFEAVLFPHNAPADPKALIFELRALECMASRLGRSRQAVRLRREIGRVCRRLENAGEEAADRTIRLRGGD